MKKKTLLKKLIEALQEDGARLRREEEERREREERASCQKELERQHVLQVAELILPALMPLFGVGKTHHAAPEEGVGALRLLERLAGLIDGLDVDQSTQFLAILTPEQNTSLTETMHAIRDAIGRVS